jgi:hypothetical protein
MSVLSLYLASLLVGELLTFGVDGVNVDMAGALVSPLISAPRFDDLRGLPMISLILCVPRVEICCPTLTIAL